MNFLLDTNAIIYLINGRLAMALPDGRYEVSVITEIELLSFPDLRVDEEQRIRAFLAVCDRVAIDETIPTKKATDVTLAADVLAEAKALGSGISRACGQFSWEPVRHEWDRRRQQGDRVFPRRLRPRLDQDPDRRAPTDE